VVAELHRRLDSEAVEVVEREVRARGEAELAEDGLRCAWRGDDLFRSSARREEERCREWNEE